MINLKERVKEIAKKSIENRYILNMEHYVFGILYLFLFIQILIGTKAWYSKLQGVCTSRIVIMALVSSIILFGIFKLNQQVKGSLMPFLWIIWIIIQSIYIYTTFSQTSSDAYVVNHYAYWVPRKDLEDFYYCYFARYQNNIGLVWLLYLIYKLINNFTVLAFEDTWLLLAVLAAIFADIAIYYTVKFARLYLNKRYECLIFIFSCFLIGLSEEGSIFYTDIVSLWTVPCFFYLLTKNVQTNCEDRKRNIINYVSMGIVLGIGGWLKPQVLVAFIAYVCFKIFSRDAIRKKLCEVLVVGSIIVMSRFLLSNMSIVWFQSTLPERLGNCEKYMDDNKYPMIHWMNMGFNYETIGGYSEEDAIYTESLLGYSNKKTVLSESLKNRLQSHTLSEWCQYINEKMIFSLQNGSFSQEFVWKGELLNRGKNSVKIQKYFVAAYDEYYNGIGIIIQTMYLFCMYGTAVTVWKKNDKRSEDTVLDVSTIALIGIVIFLIMFERNIRYFYTYIPLIIVLGFSIWNKEVRGLL